ncbi:MAG: tRNA lysidine(34) synthetase TilS [Actinomycetota bacterium]|nr:tRNA lysidine(34) synthetase TilS [Actinomycetota bacterium]
MGGPHPAVAEIRRAVRSALAGIEGPVLVACSGGADSLALAAATAFEAPRRSLRAGLITLDHGLQPGSALQAARVAALGYELGLDPVLTVPVTVGKAGGPEAAARTARYGALSAAAQALGARVLLGHTLDDQAETVLLGLGRGSGPRSIAGMRAVDGHYLRPLLGVRRATTEAACTALGLQPWDDPQNADPAFQRVRLRHEVLPLLEDILQGGVAGALARTAALLREDLDALDRIAAASSAAAASSDATQPGQHLDVAVLVGLPRALRTRALQTWARYHRLGPLTSVHVDALEVLVTDWHGQGPLHLPGGRVVRASGKLVAHPAAHRNPQE